MENLVLAWRNLWRNPRRTLLTAAALGLGVMAMVASDAYMQGVFGKIVETTANGLTGHAQLHAPGWQQTRDDQLRLPPAEALLARTRQLPVVRAAAPRSWGAALLAIGDRNRSVQLLGVVPADEAKVGRWPERLAAGRFLDPSAGGEMGGEVVIGAPLAKRLEIELDTRVVVTAADVQTGEARSELLKVVGLLKSSDPLLDEAAAVVLLPVGQRLLGLGGSIHEVALRLHTPQTAPALGIDTDDAAEIARALAPLAVAGQVEPIAWHTAQPLVAEMMKMRSSWMFIFLGLIFMVIAFVIVGTMSMAMLERTWEFALLRALGTPPLRLGAVVLAESAWLGLVGALPGALAGYGLAAWLQKIGIRYGENVTMIISFSEPIRPVPSATAALQYALVFSALTVLVSAVAAFRAGRVEPALTLRSR